MQDLPRAPPVALGNTNDHEVLAILRNFGKRLCRPENEILQACNLASGPADLAVILERPGPNQDYSISFEQFVADCKTLKAVDDLIKFATKGARSIYTVTVLDAFSFKPLKDQPQPSNEECQELVAEVLLIKRPRVLLCCWSGGCTDHWVNQFRSFGVGRLPLQSQGVIKEHPVIIVRSFHPAKAVCYEKCNADYRVLLIYHFISAFAELGKPIRMPEWISKVNQRSIDDARDDTM